MPIAFERDGDDVLWRQTFERPAVYLDIFAIRHISKSLELTQRFAEAIKSSRGTWMFTPITVSEFARFSDGTHSTEADALLRAVLPNIHLALPEIREGWGEGNFEDDADRPVPAADEPNKDFFARKFAPTGDAVEALHGVFSMLNEHRDQMSEVLNEVGAHIECAGPRDVRAVAFRVTCLPSFAGARRLGVRLTNDAQLSFAHQGCFCQPDQSDKGTRGPDWSAGWGRASSGHALCTHS